MNGSATVLKTLALLATIFGAIFVVILPLYSRNDSPLTSQVQANADSTEAAKQQADRATLLAHAAFEDSVRRDKICSSDNEMACRSLFNRLARNITEAQRFRLACTVLGALKTSSARTMRRRAGCR